MSLGNINKVLILFVIFLLFSCSNISLIDKKSTFDVPIEVDQIEKEDFIEESKLKRLVLNDFYNTSSDYKWQESTNLKNIYSLSLRKNSNSVHRLSYILISKNNIYYVDNKIFFKKIDLSNGNVISEIKLDNKINYDLINPTSIVKIDEYFYIGYGNGTVIKVDDNGKKYWEKNFNDLLRTPLKVSNNNILVLLNSNKILLLNSKDGSIIWEYSYNLNKPSLSRGGQIMSWNNIIFFIMPNGRIGAIDTIVGEQIEYKFLAQLIQKNIKNFNYESQLHIYENLFSFIDEKKNFYTYDLKNNDFLLFNEKFYITNSFIFLNNALIILDNNRFLKSYNIKNKKIFWKIDLSKFLSKNDEIVQSFINDSSFLLFFSNGLMLQFNKINGDIIFQQNLNLKNINHISSYKDYFIFYQTNGKILFYKQ